MGFVRYLMLMLLVVPACKKKVPPVVYPEHPPVASPDVTMQIAALSPSAIPANTQTSLSVLGAGFEADATVRIGNTAVSGSVSDPYTIKITTPALAAGVYDVHVSQIGADTTMHGGLIVRDMSGGMSDIEALMAKCGSVVIYFETGRDALSGRSKALLDDTAACYKGFGAPIAVGGHADSRGTIDFNLALGQRRAVTVKSYLLNKGVASTRLQVTSYGEERPVDRSNSENAWSKNRRVELNVIR